MILRGRVVRYNETKKGENSVGRGQGMSKGEEVRNRIVCGAEDQTLRATYVLLNLNFVLWVKPVVSM